MTTIPQQQDLPRGLHVSTQRLAWGILLAAFGAFCVVCLLTSFGVNYFLFRSGMPMETVVQVGRGSVGVTGTTQTDQRVLNYRDLQRNEAVSTDSQSQAALSFYDPRHDRQLVASVTLKGASSLRFGNALRPRFEWSNSGYELLLHNVQGEIDVLVPRNLERDPFLTFVLPGNEYIYLTSSGRYTISAYENEITLINREGTAAIAPTDPQQAQGVPAGQRAVLTPGSAELAIIPSYEELLVNSTFDDLLANDFGVTAPVPYTWACINGPTDQPRGNFATEFIDGHLALRLSRLQNASSHGETRCSQTFGPEGRVGRDVTMYNYLEIRTRMNIAGQSLNVCGTQGSECPLMLSLDYIDENQVSSQWFHGFYARMDVPTDYPATCLSCLQEHEQINQGVWFTYESGNLFTLLPEGRRPASILNVRFYASGHEYDVFVGEVSLLAGNTTTPQLLAEG